MGALWEAVEINITNFYCFKARMVLARSNFEIAINHLFYRWNTIYY